MAAICVVAPYPELAEVADKAIRELDLAAEVDVAVGDLHDGLACARRLAEAGTEVLVSRGGTALLLKRHLLTPVVEVEVTAVDLLRCLSELPPGFSGRVRVIGFGNVIRGAELVGRLLKLDLSYTVLSESLSFQSVLSEAVREGVDVVVGDAVTIRMARESGIRGLLITSGEEAVQAALQEARRLRTALRQERRRTCQLKAILDSSHDAIVAVDEEQRVTVFNRSAEALFGLPAESVLQRPAAAVLPDGSALAGSEPVTGRLEQVRGVTVLVNRVAVREGSQVTGTVTTYRSVSELESTARKVHRELHARGLVARARLEQITAISEPIVRVLQMARRFAASDLTLLLLGESGTGKEMVAQGVHNASPRRDGPFVAVNCAALPESLLESELFGYAEGAFTGASKGGRPGLFELASQGTIFLDEIGEMPAALQSRLLRVLQERQVMRVGGDRVLPVDIRVIAATNRDLAKDVQAGRFRQDLFYRLNVLPLVIPPLRERQADIPVLLQQFLAREAARQGCPQVRLGPELMAVLQQYPWPGNIRELMNLAERLTLLASDGKLDAETVAALMAAYGPSPGASAAATDAPATAAGAAPSGTLEEIVDGVIRSVLAAEGGNLSRAARRLGIDRTTLWRRLRH